MTEELNIRYNRQILFPKIGKEGQRRLAESRIAIVGCGALGTAHAETLARAGVGYIRLIDRDFVEHTNLQRQILFTEEDAEFRYPKAAAAAARLNEVNSQIKIGPKISDFNARNAEDLLSDVNLVIDGTDNFETRYLINDVCVKAGIPWIYGAAVSTYGATMTIRPGSTPCLRCIFAEMPPAGSLPTCDTAGVIMPIILNISSIQTSEAIKLLCGAFEDLHNSLIQLDIWNMDFRRIKLEVPDKDCPCCGKRNFEFLNNFRQESTVLCGRNAVQVLPRNTAGLDLEQLADKLKFIYPVEQNRFLVRFSTGEFDISVFADGRAIIKGTDDQAVAKSIYAKFIGA
jgi:adenylyltransferase/sulfurtransferase